MATKFPPTVVFRDDHSAGDGQHSSPGKHLQNGSVVSPGLRWCTGGIGFCSSPETATATCAVSSVVRKENRCMLNALAKSGWALLELIQSYESMSSKVDIRRYRIPPVVPPPGEVDYVDA